VLDDGSGQEIVLVGRASAVPDAIKLHVPRIAAK